MNIDAPQIKDLPQLRRLWQEAFSDSEDFLDGFFATGFSHDRSLCLKIGDRPVAALYWFDCFLDGDKLAYLYAIATEKAYRGRGLCGQLMSATHQKLKALGYAGSVLVPAGERLFAFYGAMGYTGFCPMAETTVTAGPVAADLKKLTATDYFAIRRQYAPKADIRQEQTADYLATFTEFYGADGAVMCMSREGERLYFQEFLGDPHILPGVLTALGAKTGHLRLPGGNPYAMHLGFEKTLPEDAYLGIPLG